MESYKAQQSKALLIAISGPSCSGKTTLSRLLRDALAPFNAFIIHQDDFYRIDSKIPVVRVADGQELQDWDCKESVDFDDLEEMLVHVKRTGTMKDGFKSKEDLNDVGQVDVHSNEIKRNTENLVKSMQHFVGEAGRKVVIVDGFLLFARGLERISDLFDIRLLLTVDYETLKTRREARKGYQTIEGFWEDPAGYVDWIVWPNYVKDHTFLYRDGQIKNGVDKDVCTDLGIRSRPDDTVHDMTLCFKWAVEQIINCLEHEEGGAIE